MKKSVFTHLASFTLIATLVISLFSFGGSASAAQSGTSETAAQLRQDILGTWSNVGAIEILTFYSDGTCSDFNTRDGTYEISDDMTLKLDFPWLDTGYGDTYTWNQNSPNQSWNLSNDMLIINNVKYQKVETSSSQSTASASMPSLSSSNASSPTDTPDTSFTTRPMISEGNGHTVGLKSDGTVVAVGRNDYNQSDVSNWNNIISISAGLEFTVGLKKDGTVVATGDNYWGQCNVSDWEDITAISAGNNHTVGLKKDGTVVTTGYNNYGESNVSDWKDIIAISAAFTHTVGLKKDGTVVTAGTDYSDETEISNWKDIIAISASDSHVVGLKQDGTVVAVGDNSEGQCNVSSWKDIVAIATGSAQTIGLKSDGTVIAVGDNENGQCNVSDWKNIVSISASYWRTVGLKNDGSIVATGKITEGQDGVSKWDLGTYTSPPTVVPLSAASASASNGQATVTFQGLPSTGNYTVISNPGGITATGKASPITVTGLKNGTTYTFTVVTTSNGKSVTTPPSNAVTPESAVSGPVSLSFTTTDYTGDKLVTIQSNWLDSWFGSSSTQYNGDLATTSMILSAAAYSSESSPTNPSYANSSNVVGDLKTLGFGTIETHNYTDNPQGVIGAAPDTIDADYDIVGYTFAYKTVTENGTDYNLVAVVIRGTNGKEWFSDFNIGTPTTALPAHQGFQIAESTLEGNLYTYLGTHHLTNKLTTKFLITGHSRGAAVANLLAYTLTKKQQFCTPDNLFAYTFATPNVTTASDTGLTTDTTAYNNIFNIVNPEDFVPYMPLTQWGYWKYGKTLAFPTPGVGSGTQAMTDMENEFKNLTGYGFQSYDVAGTYGFAWTQMFTNNLFDLAKSPSDYYNKSYNLLPGVNKTPQQYFTLLCHTLIPNDSEGGNAITVLLASYVDVLSDYQYVTRFFVDHGNGILSKQMNLSHAPETYVAWMLETNDNLQNSTNLKGQYARIACPVDITVYDSSNKLVGKVTNNVVDTSISSDVSIIVQGDVKYVYFPQGSAKYTIKFTGTGTGTMDYSVENYNVATTLPDQQKEYKNVAISKGKEFSSDIGVASTTPLYLTKNGNIIGQVMPDGSIKANTPWYVYVGGSLGLVAIIALVMILFLRARKKHA